jgi:sortase (surface protein transpeptidase)
MPTGCDFSQEMKQLMFHVIKFVESEKRGCVIPLNNVNERLKTMLSISASSVEKLKREMKEQENEMLERERQFNEERRRLDEQKRNRENQAIEATLRLRNPRSSSNLSVTSATTARSLTVGVPVAQPPRKYGHSGRPTILLSDEQKENIR